MLIAFKHIETKRYLANAWKGVADTTKMKEDAKKWDIRFSSRRRDLEMFKKNHEKELEHFEEIVIG